jgi:hypothetical protein
MYDPRMSISRRDAEALAVKPVVRMAACIWLLGWAAFGLPWGGLRPRPRLSKVQLVPFYHTRPADNVVNLLYYIPMGVIGVALGCRAAAVAGTAVLLSGSTEFAQLFSRVERFPSTTDLILNTTGALVGIALAETARRAMTTPDSGAESRM